MQIISRGAPAPRLRSESFFWSSSTLSSSADCTSERVKLYHLKSLTSVHGELEREGKTQGVLRVGHIARQVEAALVDGGAQPARLAARRVEGARNRAARDRGHVCDGDAERLEGVEHARVHQHGAVAAARQRHPDAHVPPRRLLVQGGKPRRVGRHRRADVPRVQPGAGEPEQEDEGDKEDKPPGPLQRPVLRKVRYDRAASADRLLRALFDDRVQRFQPQPPAREQ